VEKVLPEDRTTTVSPEAIDSGHEGSGTHVSHHGISGSSHVVYHDRPHQVRHTNHYQHAYRDRHNQLRHRLVWPTSCFSLYYRRGPCLTYRYVYPYYHRKYIFVSLGGYWPIGYSHRRYYWYGCHPYFWYGYYPIAREVRGDTRNYYTYNYYGVGDTVTSELSQTTDYVGLVDHETFADVREKLAQEGLEQPGEVTLADSFFEDAVKAFEACDYDKAVEMFASASNLAPDDMVLPFAYSQALFAKGQYSQAIEVLRPALTKVPSEEEGPLRGESQEVFYPRGLYSDDNTLFEQIDQLSEKAELYSFDADLQLLLGYQLLGIGQTDEAFEPLLRASKDLENEDAAATLLKLLERIRTENSEGESSD
jgi:tetratricopeptide (TPR) repeat protein